MLAIPDCLPRGLQWQPLRFLHSQGPVGTWLMLRLDGDSGGDPEPDHHVVSSVSANLPLERKEMNPMELGPTSATSQLNDLRQAPFRL